MKKKTLIILLIIPILIGLISFVSITILVNTVAIDIDGISWNYSSQVGFKISNELYKLEATPVILDSTKIIDNGNNLIWEIDSNDYASIIKEDDNYYLKCFNEGKSVITCSNEKKTVAKSFTAIIYENSAIIINNDIPKASESSLVNASFFDDSKYVYGEYDYIDSSISESKTRSYLKLDVEVVGENNSSSVEILNTSSNIEYDETNKIFNFISSGEAYIEFFANDLIEYYSFTIIENGVNIYSYDDLLRATNKNDNGDIIVLRTNLLSLDSLYKYDEVSLSSSLASTSKIYKDEVNSNVNEKIDKLFGHFDFTYQSFSFEEEIYTYESTYLVEYIDDLNSNEEFLKNNDEIDKTINVGINLKKNLYGNGYTISFSNLTFPRYGKMYGKYGKSGRLIPFDTASDTSKEYEYKGKDLFDGPNYFISIGDFNETNFIAAYGEDNTSILIENDNVIIDSVAINGSDQSDNLYDYSYCGTVINVFGDNCSIKNSLLANGKNIVRAFSSDNLLIDNSILSRSAEFLLLVGSNEYEKVDDSKDVSFSYGNTTQNGSLGDLKNTYIDYYLSKYIGLDGDTLGSFFDTPDDVSSIESLSNDGYISFLNDLQSNVYDYIYDEESKIDSHIKVNDTYFQTSGIYSIALETNFNGPYLYNGGPTPISSTFSSLLNVPSPSNISGTSKGVELTLSGNTAFYDYKDIDSMDMNTIIEDNLSTLVNSFFGDSLDSSEISIDNFFPIKSILKDEASEYIYKVEEEVNGEKEEKKYINSKILYYGGGVNNSKVINECDDSLYSSDIDINLVKAFTNGTYSNVSSSSTTNKIVSILAKCVLMVTGAHNFKTVLNSKVINNSKPTDFDLRYDVTKIKDNFK